MIEKRSMAGQKKGRKKDGGRVKEGGLRGREAPAGRCNVSSRVGGARVAEFAVGGR